METMLAETASEQESSSGERGERRGKLTAQRTKQAYDTDKETERKQA